MSVFYDMERMISLFCLFLFTRGGWEKQVGTVVEAILSFISRSSCISLSPVTAGQRIMHSGEPGKKTMKNMSCLQYS